MNQSMKIDSTKDIIVHDTRRECTVSYEGLNRKKEIQTSVKLLDNENKNKQKGTDKEKSETITSLENIPVHEDISLKAGTNASLNRKTHSKDQRCNKIDTEWKQDANAWRMCIERSDKREVQRLICERILPDREMLNKASTAFGNNLQILKSICDEICSYIKSESNKIINVYAVYENAGDKLEENALAFAVISTSSIAFENTFGYTIELICIHEVNFSLENKVIKLKEEMEYPKNDDEIIKAEKVMNLHSQGLMKMHKNISRISISWIKSTQFGTWDAAMRNEVCVSLYVPKKGLIPIGEKPFPKILDGLAVDVREGVCVPFLGSHDVHKNIKIGCAISGKRMSDQSYIGTLGGFFENNNNVYGLTCAHVFKTNPNLTCLNINGTWEAKDTHDPLNYVYQPSPITEPFGTLIKAVFTPGDPNTSSVDAAVFHVQNRHPNSGIFPDAENDRKAGFDADNPMLFNSGKLSDKVERMAVVVKHGISTGITKGRVRACSALFRMSVTSDLNYDFYKMYEIDSFGDTEFAREGDSGAMVFTVEDNELVGIGIVQAGMGYNCYVTPIYDVFRALCIPPPFEMKKFVMDDDTRAVSSGSVISNHQDETKREENTINDKFDNLNPVMSHDIAKQIKEVSTKIDQQLSQFKTEIHWQNEQLCTDLEKKMKDMHKESYDKIQKKINQLLQTVQTCSQMDGK